MKTNGSPQTGVMISSLEELAPFAVYSFMDTLNCDPDATQNGKDHAPRQVYSGHYVPVKPTPIPDPIYVAHSTHFFQELGFADSLATTESFMRMFSGDLSLLPQSMRQMGWATGYALSIFGTEYIRQCPFQTGNGYGDGRAVSILEILVNERHWEMQLKGGGRTPYCRGADGRAVLRSSVREFLAQEHMHALGVPTSRSLSLYVSGTETVERPWYSPGSRSVDPDILVPDAVAISTRVASSFIRVGQIELFARRARKQEHPSAVKELEQMVLHLVEREYDKEIAQTLSLSEKALLLAQAFQHRLTSLVANWMRVGYCQGNFNSDNCAAGGFTLDYGPFGFCEAFDPYFQPWTGGGQHFAFFNQPEAAKRNFDMFCKALKPLLEAAQNPTALRRLDEIQDDFMRVMQDKMEKMWAAKLGLDSLDEDLVNELASLMLQTPVDYTIFFRELSSVPDDIAVLKKSFYTHPAHAVASSHLNYANASVEMDKRWATWLQKWRKALTNNSAESCQHDVISAKMKKVNPKYILREWQLAPAYQQAAQGNYALLHELQEVMTKPYAEQSRAVEEKFYQLKPSAYSDMGGVSHMSCSS